MAATEGLLGFQNGRKMLHQFEDGDHVCTIYELSVITPAGASLTFPVANWSRCRTARSSPKCGGGSDRRHHWLCRRNALPRVWVADGTRVRPHNIVCIKRLVVAGKTGLPSRGLNFAPSLMTASRSPHAHCWTSTFSMRRSGMSHITATSTYSAQASHACTNDKGIATA